MVEQKAGSLVVCWVESMVEQKAEVMESMLDKWKDDMWVVRTVSLWEFQMEYLLVKRSDLMTEMMWVDRLDCKLE